MAAWKALRELYFAARRERALDIERARVRLTHDLEQERARLEARPENTGRRSQITQLTKEIARLRGRAGLT